MAAGGTDGSAAEDLTIRGDVSTALAGCASKAVPS